MSARSYSRGWAIYYDGENWRYLDNNEIIDNNERSCKRCGRTLTKEGYDACLDILMELNLLVVDME